MVPCPLEGARARYAVYRAVGRADRARPRRGRVGGVLAELLRDLRRRRLQGVRLCVSDHEGLRNAIARVLAAPCQRCTIHFVRNMHQQCRPSQRGLVSAARDLQRRGPRAGQRAGRRGDRPPRRVGSEMAELLEAAEEDLLAFYALAAPHWSKLRSTNPLERVKTARSAAAPNVVGILPTTPPRSASPAHS